MENNRPRYLDLAQIVTHFGLKGDLKVRPETDDPLRLRELKSVDCLLASGQRCVLDIERVNLRKDGVLLVKFSGYDTPEAAAALRKARLQIPYERAKRPKGTVLYADVIGLKVVAADSGNELGVVTEVLRAAQDLLEIRTPDGREVLVPWVDAFVQAIDLEAGVVKLSLVEGLFE